MDIRISFSKKLILKKKPCEELNDINLFWHMQVERGGACRKKIDRAYGRPTWMNGLQLNSFKLINYYYYFWFDWIVFFKWTPPLPSFSLSFSLLQKLTLFYQKLKLWFFSMKDTKWWKWNQSVIIEEENMEETRWWWDLIAFCSSSTRQRKAPPTH